MNIRIPESLRLDFIKKVSEWNDRFQKGNHPFPISSIQEVRDRIEEKASFFLVGFYENHLKDFNAQLFYELNSKMKEVSRGDKEIYGLGQKNLQRLINNRIESLNLQAFELIGYFTYEGSWHSVKQELAKIELSMVNDGDFRPHLQTHAPEFQSNILLEVKRLFGEQYSISVNTIVKGISEFNRLFHIYLSGNDRPIKHEIGFRIGSQEQEVNHDDIELLTIHCNDCRFSKGVFISPVGYTDLAVKVAKRNGIILSVLRSSRKLDFISRLTDSESDKDDSVLVYFIPQNGFFDVPSRMGRKMCENLLPYSEKGSWSVSVFGDGIVDYINQE